MAVKADVAHNIRYILDAILFFTLMYPLSSQTSPPPMNADPGVDSLRVIGRPVETINVHVHEVNLVLGVTDHHGKVVNNLQPSDFRILDNGVEQTKLTFFARETDLPIKLALVIDISASVAYQLATECDAVELFLKEVASPLDSVTLFAFNRSIQLRSPVTNNWNTIAKLLKDLHPRGETALYDAVSEASQWLALDNGSVRRVMILVSDGQDNESTSTIDTTISNALNAEAIIYSVHVRGEEVDQEAKRGATILKQLAEATGGAYLDYRIDTIARAFEEVRLDLRSQYALAYQLPNPGMGTFHRLRVLVANHRKVRCRSGYYVK
jgi:VWFA-related protein